MKILYCSHGDYWGSTWPYSFIDGYIARALSKMGHEVEVFDIFEHAKMVAAYLNDYAKRHNTSQIQHMALSDYFACASIPLKVLEFKPDLLLHIVGRIPSVTLAAMSSLNAKKAIWYLDDPQEIEKTAAQGAFYDNVFTVESACTEKYIAAGSKKVKFLPLGCDPDVHKIIEVEDKYKSDICFIGVPFKRRIEFFDSIADFLAPYNVKIIGGGPNIGSQQDPWLWKRKLKRLDVLDKFIIDDIMAPEEAAKYYNGASININIHREAVDDRFARSNADRIQPTAVSGRTFEIAGCAGFQMIDNIRSDFSVHFEEDKEIVSFSDAEEFKEKAAYYLNNTSKAKEIGKRSQTKAYKMHTYINRMENILSECRDPG